MFDHEPLARRFRCLAMREFSSIKFVPLLRSPRFAKSFGRYGAASPRSFGSRLLCAMGKFASLIFITTAAARPAYTFGRISSRSPARRLAGHVTANSAVTTKVTYDRGRSRHVYRAQTHKLNVLRVDLNAYGRGQYEV